MDFTMVIFVFFVMFFFGGVGSIVAAGCRTSTKAGFIYGFCLGPIGWIITALLEKEPASTQTRLIPHRIPDIKPCEQCSKELIVTDLPAGNYECRFCGWKFKIG
jgi:hypothetical protein